MSVGGEIGELHRNGSVGMPAAYGNPAFDPGYPVSAYNNPAGPVTPARSGAVEDAMQRRSVEYNGSVESLNAAQREVAVEVEQALLALRGRIDELLVFTQGGGQPTPASEGALVPSTLPASLPPSSLPPSSTPRSERRAPPLAPRSEPPNFNMAAMPPSPVQQPAVFTSAPTWAVPSPRAPRY